MSAQTQTSLSQGLTLQPVRASDLANAVQARQSWLWHGYLAPGKITALISPPKSGKTTLLSHLLARCGESTQLAGLAIAPGRALVVSEESAADWGARCQRRGLGGHVQFVCRPFQGARPSDEQWLAMVAQLEAIHRQEKLDLVVIDALAALLPGYAESSGPKMLDCLLPLQALAHQGPAVWLLHHPAKDKRPDGLNARGAGALSGFADIIMEMSCVRRARSRDRRRRICSYSRYAETPRHLIIELNADGSDYTVRTDSVGRPLVESWREVQYVLSNEYWKRSQQWILQYWPAEDDPPDRSTLSRWLRRAAQQGLLCCSGTGLKGDPLVYWLPGREPLLFPGDNAGEQEIQAWRDRIAAHERSLREQQGAA